MIDAIAGAFTQEVASLLLILSTVDAPGLFTSVRKLLYCQTASPSIERSNALKNSYGFFVSAVAHQVTRGFLKLEEKETDRPENDGYGSEGEEEVSPSHVLAASTCARCSSWGAREVGDERPCDQGGEKLSDRPPYGKYGQQILRRSGDKVFIKSINNAVYCVE